MELPHIGMENIINYQNEQSRNLLSNARGRSWCHRSSLYHPVNIEYCIQNTFFVHQNPDNVFSDLTMVHDTISLHGVIRTPPVEFTKKIQQDGNSVSKFYFIFIWSSTCFRWHTAHHQEPQTALAASSFAYVEGCWTWSCKDAVSIRQLHIQQPSMYAKLEAASAVLGSWWWAVCRPKHVELYINIK